MLSRLTIKNVALIEYADIYFQEGLNVLSGETGAGKSVILDSVNFVLGAKADRSMIRYGETECLVKAEFIVSKHSKAIAALQDLDIDSDGEIIISRKFSDNGKNAIKINGNTVTATMLRSVTDSLVDVHGQSEHFFLLKESNQLRMLDSIIGNPIDEKKAVLRECLAEKRAIKEQISLLGGDEQERNRRLDVLRFQIDEIQSADLQEGEEALLLSKREKMNNVEKILSAIRDAVAAIDGENGAIDGLRYANRAVNGIARLDEEYANLSEKLEGLAIEAQDVVGCLTDIGDSLYFDENEAMETESRLDLIKSLKRKYGATKDKIDEYLCEISDEYELLSDCEGKYAILTARLSSVNDKIYSICQKITAIRQKEGKAFCDRVVAELKTLNIPSAQFTISFRDYGEEDVERANNNGLDEICFMFSANAGEPMKELGKIISGGEMSRFMLAIKTQLSNVNEISTYIFDEIDAGISGKTAKVVGEKLARIAKTTQLLVVSHLAQIAVMSDKEYLIEKQELGGKTVTLVHDLDESGKREEIVRLLGGEDGGDYAYKHADELLKQAETYKNSLTI